MLKESKSKIISKRLNKVLFDKDVDEDFLMCISEKMDCYVIQDLIDYCDKVLFEIFKGKYELSYFKSDIYNCIIDVFLFLNSWQQEIKQNYFNKCF